MRFRDSHGLNREPALPGFNGHPITLVHGEGAPDRGRTYGILRRKRTNGRFTDDFGRTGHKRLLQVVQDDPFRGDVVGRDLLVDLDRPHRHHHLDNGGHIGGGIDGLDESPVHSQMNLEHSTTERFVRSTGADLQIDRSRRARRSAAEDRRSPPGNRRRVRPVPV
jgi:hypothetical protein